MPNIVLGLFNHWSVGTINRTQQYFEVEFRFVFFKILVKLRGRQRPRWDANLFICSVTTLENWAVELAIGEYPASERLVCSASPITLNCSDYR